MAKQLVFISIIAALVACLADVLLLYHPSGNYHIGDYAFLKEISLDRMLIGHYLGILIIPFELLGIWVFINTFKEVSTKNRQFAFAIVIFVLIIGVAYHGMLVFVAEAIQQNGVEVAQNLRRYFEPLSVILGVIFVMLCSTMIYALQKGWSTLSSQLVWFNPILVYLLLIGLYIFIPSIGNLLIVTGFNFSIAIFLVAVYKDLN